MRMRMRMKENFRCQLHGSYFFILLALRGFTIQLHPCECKRAGAGPPRENNAPCSWLVQRHRGAFLSAGQRLSDHAHFAVIGLQGSGPPTERSCPLHVWHEKAWEEKLFFVSVWNWWGFYFFLLENTYFQRKTYSKKKTNENSTFTNAQCSVFCSFVF